MEVILSPAACEAGQILPLAVADAWRPCHILKNSPGRILTGMYLYTDNEPENAAFQACGTAWLPGAPAFRAPLLKALRPCNGGETRSFSAQKRGATVGVITLSDKGARGEREDKAGPLAQSLAQEYIKIAFSQCFLLPDDKHQLRALLAELALAQGYDLIITSGGTGVAPTDLTPEAMEPLLDMRLPGFAAAMLMASLAKTPRAMISRALTGVIGRCLVINVPGSPKAVRENLEPVLPALEHTLAKLAGDTADCGGKA